MAVVAFDVFGTLFDLGDLEERMPRVLFHATALTLVGEWVPFRELVEAVDPELPRQLAKVEAYDDARPALEAVDEAWTLTNGGREFMEALLERAGLRDLVAQVRTTEEVQKYKPHPDVYGLLPKGAVLVAAHAWDCFGALTAGYDAVWVERGPWPFPGDGPELRAGTLLEAAELAARRDA